jgi:hypothetical protein
MAAVGGDILEVTYAHETLGSGTFFPKSGEDSTFDLGGFRGDLSVLKEKVSADGWEAAMETCRKVARLYRSLHVGIDLMFEPDLQAHRVLEANAFGDLLPNLTLEGLDVWEWQIREALRHPPTGRWLHGAS